MINHDKITARLNKIIRRARPSYKRYEGISAFKYYYGAAIRDGRKLLFWESDPLFTTRAAAIARAKEIQKAGFTTGEV